MYFIFLWLSTQLYLATKQFYLIHNKAKQTVHKITICVFFPIGVSSKNILHLSETS
jgi:hypothetical protein